MEQNNEEKLLAKLEAILFLAARWLSFEKLVRLSGINPITLRDLLAKLQAKHAQGGLEIIERNGKWKMDVKQEYAQIVNLLAAGQSEFTKAEQATLALIAYKQPIKQSVVVKIRGNKAYDHIKELIQANLIKAKKAGRTLELSLTDHFYDYFNLKNANS